MGPLAGQPALHPPVATESTLLQLLQCLPSSHGTVLPCPSGIQALHQVGGHAWGTRLSPQEAIRAERNLENIQATLLPALKPPAIVSMGKLMLEKEGTYLRSHGEARCCAFHLLVALLSTSTAEKRLCSGPWRGMGVVAIWKLLGQEQEKIPHHPHHQGHLCFAVKPLVPPGRTVGGVSG